MQKIPSRSTKAHPGPGVTGTRFSPVTSLPVCSGPKQRWSSRPPLLWILPLQSGPESMESSNGVFSGTSQPGSARWTMEREGDFAGPVCSTPQALARSAPARSFRPQIPGCLPRGRGCRELWFLQELVQPEAVRCDMKTWDWP